MIDRDGSFLDLGCANGLLMESVVLWAGERGHRIEPYGVDISPALVALARERLPQWHERIWTGNAIDWVHPDRRHFDFVHALFDLVPSSRVADLLGHALQELVAPGGRLLVSQYGTAGTPDAPTAADLVSESGFAVSGRSCPRDPDFRSGGSTAWTDRRLS